MAAPENLHPESWASFLNPDEATLDRLQRSPAYVLVSVGTAWDTVGDGWEALVVAPMERGLAALDALDLPLDCGHPVIADHARNELIALVPGGTADRAAAAGPQGVRPLAAGAYLVVPHGPSGAFVAAWLSRPTIGAARYVDAFHLCAAVLDADARRGEHVPAC
ncbi:hypothetical protein ACFY0G_40435 [Streptomyces sp. NPDC001552]|uniref:hypothetical protein n=1 Tax=Streptomyces sp. NPDC001552 TaxID=3364587 RepID=UPI0036ACE74E